jgi:hypothetical protein
MVIKMITCFLSVSTRCYSEKSSNKNNTSVFVGSIFFFLFQPLQSLFHLVSIIVSVRSLYLVFGFFAIFRVSPALAEDITFAKMAYEKGHYELAYPEFKRLAVTDPNAQYYLGRMFEHGEGVNVNSQRAVRWYLKSADAGNVEAEAALGSLFTLGGGEQLPKNYKEAVRWYTKAAEKGHAEAAARFGDFYLTGRGGEKDSALGVAWLQESRYRGNEQATLQLEQLKKQLPIAVFETAKQLKPGLSKLVISKPVLSKKGQGRHE